MKELLKDIGIKKENLIYYNFEDYKKVMDTYQLMPSDRKIQYFKNALFVPLNMTDYEESFIGFNELGSSLPLGDLSMVRSINPEPIPMLH